MKNSKKLTKVVSWSLENKNLWCKLCYFPEDDVTLEDISRLLDECKHQGFMELYYLLLSRVGEVIEHNIHDPKFIKFIKNSLDKDITLNMNELKKIQSGHM